MNTNNPTTGEIVRALRRHFDNGKHERPDAWARVAADRLEMQDNLLELQNEALKIVNGTTDQSNKTLTELNRIIAALTARAEKAEAFIKCSECKQLTILNTESVYAKCHKRGITFFPFDTDTRRMGCMDGERGLPQDGEGK